ncbi:low affinity potassium transporter [Pseudogymnoascus destructans]|uniref:Potassium transport protein n=2 Tax=Pseudogymnoascus destructans TaxID=655981 RepID=L8G9X0_PSED2|nr:low affinity potassium transporter [Pseudogymnoascus destructans]ELR08836.1 hypothetical protein GMDG_03510 [Pseudogymnoascus destructans 20631-21]OAF61755.1 low affinity potassium transporter [Pseudogymnoascus destructans]
MSTFPSPAVKMVFQPFVDAWHQVKAMKPSFLSRNPHFNFITVHYFWIVGMAFLGSILVFAPGKITYIDALFFSAGSCTQSGLNPLDFNNLNTFQQIVLYLLPMMTNPITNNTFVVFLRLYWFEKRFQHIAKEAKRSRRSMSKTRSQMKGERDTAIMEHGVNGRTIRVIHETTRMGTAGHPATEEHTAENTNANANAPRTPYAPNLDDYAITFDKSESESPKHEAPPLKTAPTIKFADQVKRSDGVDSEYLRVPSTREPETHIEFLERQRRLTGGALRIPGPRDADRGVAPETIDEAQIMSGGMVRSDSDVEPLPRGLNGPNVEPESSQSPSTDSGTSDRSSASENHPETVDYGREEYASRSQHASESTRAAAHSLGVLRFRKPRLLSGDKVHGEHEKTERSRSRAMTLTRLKSHFTKDKEQSDPMPYISFQPTIGRNSAFVDLSEAEREELGGIEYRSLKTLAIVLVSYFWFGTIFTTISLVPWIVNNARYGPIVDAAGMSRTWWGFFTAMSSFNDLGFSLVPDSMVSFQTAIWPLFVMSFMIIFGNTGFPVLLRFIIYCTSKLVPKTSGIWEELRFLLDHPRRCFTLLFPATATWWLFWVLVLLNGIDLIFFIILDFGNPVVTDLPPNIRVLDGWFQATSTRTAGFAVVSIADLHPAIQISYMVMMYISVFPIAISVRRTNVYEEQSLGIWGGATDDIESKSAEPSYVGSHIRRQLSFDLWFVTLGWFIMAIAEASRIQDTNQPAFNLFSYLFEIISAYGTVGLSLGYPGSNASFSAQFNVVGKLVIIAMQIRGRHRGLPYELDRAILLPSESLHQREMEDATARHRRSSFGTTVGGGEELDTATTNASGRDEGPKGLRRRTRQGSNFLSSMLHPGPSMVPRHRPSMTKRESSMGGRAGSSSSSGNGNGNGNDGGGSGGDGGRDGASIAEPVTRSNTHVPQPTRREHGTSRPIKKRMSI